MKTCKDCEYISSNGHFCELAKTGPVKLVVFDACTVFTAKSAELEKTCKNCNNLGKRLSYHKNKRCGKLCIDVQSDFYCQHFDNYKQSFQTITILSGEAGSGKSVEARRRCEGKSSIWFDHLQPISADIEVAVFYNVTSMKQIKQIIKQKLPVKEIIICTKNL